MTKIIESLHSEDFSIVDKTLKALGFEQGISGGFERCHVLMPRVSGSSRYYVVGLSWNPINGYILLMDPSGEILARKRVGYITSIGLRQLKASGDDAIVIDSVVGTGTGTQEARFYILNIDKQLSEVWEGLSYKYEYPLALAPESNYKISACIRFVARDDDKSYDLIHTLWRTTYSYREDSQTLSVIGTTETTNTYVLRNNKFVPISEPSKGER